MPCLKPIKLESGFALGTITNGIKTVWGIRSALASSRWQSDKLHVHQFRLLSSLLNHCYNRVPFYKRHFDQHRFHPADFLSLADLVHIPILEKHHLQNSPPADFLASGIDPAGCRKIATSGSSGNPLSILLHENGRRSHRIAAWRILFENGFRWTDQTLEIRMTSGPVYSAQRFGLAPKSWLSIQDTPANWVQVMLSTRPEVLVAGASTLRALAEVSPTLPSPPRLIISDSETLYPADRALISERLGSEPIDVFGLVEVSNFAWECRHHKGFHTSSDSHLVELLKNEIVVTHLDQTDMPILRYRTGDAAEWSNSGHCPCGRTLPLLSRVDGRTLDSVELPSGRTLFWPFFHEILAQFPQLRQWCVIQSTNRSLRLQLVTDPTTAANIAQSLADQLPEPLEISTETLAAIPTPSGKKFRAVLREVNQQ